MTNFSAEICNYLCLIQKRVRKLLTRQPAFRSQLLRPCLRDLAEAGQVVLVFLHELLLEIFVKCFLHDGRPRHDPAVFAIVKPHDGVTVTFFVQLDDRVAHLDRPERTHLPVPASEAVVSLDPSLLRERPDSGVLAQRILAGAVLEIDVDVVALAVVVLEQPVLLHGVGTRRFQGGGLHADHVPVRRTPLITRRRRSRRKRTGQCFTHHVPMKRAVSHEATVFRAGSAEELGEFPMVERRMTGLWL